MKVAIIINGISRKKKLFNQKILPSLSTKFEVTVFETQYAKHTIALAYAASNENFDCILAAGGDGTLNQVVNGVLRNDHKKIPALGIIPLGTGNDFAKTCGIKIEPEQLVNLLNENNPSLLDLGKIFCRDDHGNEITNHFINVCSCGMGPEVVKRLMKSDRSLGPLLTYLKAIATTFFSHQPQEIFLESEHWQWNGKVRVFAVANGKSFGNAMFIAPQALQDDGLFSTFIAGNLSLIKFLFYLQLIKNKKIVRDKLIVYNECSSIEIKSPEACAVEADGEWLGWAPIRIELLSKKIKFFRA